MLTNHNDLIPAMAMKAKRRSMATMKSRSFHEASPATF